MERISKVSDFIVKFCLFIYFILFFNIVGQIIWVMLGDGPELFLGPPPFPRISSSLLVSFSSKAIVIFLICLNYGIAIKITHHVKQLFTIFKNGIIFSKDTTWKIRQIGNTILLSVGAVLIGVPLLMFYIPTAHLEIGHIDYLFFAPINNIFFAVIVFLISWVMDIGMHLSEENELTI